MPILADLPRSAAESADEGRSRGPALRGGEFRGSADESASELQRRPPAQRGGIFDIVKADKADEKPQSKCFAALPLFIYFYPIKKQYGLVV